MKYIFVIAVTLLLGGCATANQPNKDKVLVITKCPPLKYYSKEQLEKAAEELGMLKNDSQVQAFIADYLKYRDACRATNKRAKDRINKEQKRRDSKKKKKVK